MDPLSPDYPWNSPYSFAENDVIRSIDIDGLENGNVPINQYKAPSGQSNAGRTQYTPHQIRTFKAQADRLMKNFGFHSQQVMNGRDIVNLLISETTNHGYVSRLALFGHAGPDGLFLSNDEGFYTGAFGYSGQNDKNVMSISSEIKSGKIKFWLYEKLYG